MFRGKLVLVVGVFAVAAIPDVVLAETCSMYQKYIKDCGADAICDGLGIDASTPCANQIGYFETTAESVGNGTLYSRPVPKCDATGLDTSTVKSPPGSRHGRAGRRG
jgi:hypothetical protein